jgi:hypothetical protein
MLFVYLERLIDDGPSGLVRAGPKKRRERSRMLRRKDCTPSGIIVTLIAIILGLVLLALSVR